MRVVAKRKGFETNAGVRHSPKRFFRDLGHRIRSYRTERKLSQEGMISYGFSVRHWQMIEAGRRSTLFTLLRICEAFDVQPEQLVAGLRALLPFPKLARL